MMFLVLLTSVIMVEPRAGGVTEEQKEDCPIKRKKKLFRWIYMSQSVFSFRCPALALQRYKLFGKFPHVPPLPLQIFPLLLFWLATASLPSLISCWTSRLNLKDKQHIIRRGVGLGITGFKVHFQKEIIVGPQEVLFLWFFKQVSSTHNIDVRRNTNKYVKKDIDASIVGKHLTILKNNIDIFVGSSWKGCLPQWMVLPFSPAAVPYEQCIGRPFRCNAYISTKTWHPKMLLRTYDSALKCKELLTKLKKQLFQQ